MIRARKPSSWKYDTSSTVGVSVGEIVSGAVSGGTLALVSPKGRTWPFIYGSVGGGTGIGTTVQVSSTINQDSVGQLLILEAFVGDDLSVDDLTGYCLIQDVTLTPGGSVTAMFLGLDSENLAAQAGIAQFQISFIGQVTDWILDSLDRDWPAILKSNAKAMLITAGFTKGGFGAGVTQSVGYLDTKWGDAFVGVVKGWDDRK